MVQPTGPEAEQLRIDIEIATRAELAGLQQTGRALESLQARTRDATLQSAALGRAQRTTSTELRATGEELKKIVTESFGPRTVSSLQGVQKEYVRMGEGLEQFGRRARATRQLNRGTAQSFIQIGQSMQAAGVSGNISSQTFAQFEQRLSRLRPTTEAGKASVEALRESLSRLQLQFTQAGIAAEQRLNRPLTTTQQLGQGLLLSFSLSQAAAGNLSSALFGLGFAVIFTGTKFLNLKTALVAVSGAFLSVQIDKWQKKLFDAESVQERVTKRVQEFQEGIADARGETALYNDELFQLAKTGEDVHLGWQQMLDDARDTPGVFDRAKVAVGAFVERVGQLTRLEFTEVGEKGEEFIDQWTTGAGRLEKAFGEIKRDVFGFAGSIGEILRDMREEYSRELEVNIRTEGFDQAVDDIRDGFDKLQDAAQEGLEETNRAIQKGLEQQIKDRRDALQDELDVIRDSGRDKIDTIRDELDSALQVIRDAADDRIKIIRDNAENEVEIEREKIDKLKKQDRDLNNILNQLLARRRSIISEKFRAEAQLAALEREAQLVGVKALEEQTILRARIEGLEEQEKQTDKEIDARRGAISTIEGQIEAIEDLIEQIEDARDSAVEAAQEQSREQQKAARTSADVEIREVQRVEREQTRAAQSAAEADIDAWREAADERIRNNQRAHDERMEQLREQEEKQVDIVRAQEEQFNQERRIAEQLRTEVLPAFEDILRMQVLIATQQQGAVGMDVFWVIKREVDRLREAIRIAFPGMSPDEILSDLGFGGFQMGTQVVPGPFGRPALAVVHGGEEIRTPGQLSPPDRRSYGDIYITVTNEIDLRRVRRIIAGEEGRSLGTSVRRGSKYSRASRTNRSSMDTFKRR